MNQQTKTSFDFQLSESTENEFSSGHKVNLWKITLVKKLGKE